MANTNLSVMLNFLSGSELIVKQKTEIDIRHFQLSMTLMDFIIKIVILFGPFFVIGAKVKV